MRNTASGCLNEDDVLGFVLGTLDGQARQTAVNHISDCDACRALASTLARDDDVLLERSSLSSAPPDSAVSEPPAGPDEAPLSGRTSVDGRFRLLGTLGRGAMGIVYRAHDEELGMDVALKLLREEAAGGGGARAFARELKVGRRVTHPNVCRLYDAGQYQGAPYITMELLEGETLADVLVRAGRDGEGIGEERARELLEGIAAGLAAVHAQGIVHRDLKPANVMVVRGTGRPVLTDFGFATELRGDHSRRLVGTPSFWAPEQARGEAPTPASDVYSFGLLAYRLLARRDFSLSDRTALQRLPAAWRGFIGRCLEPRPSNRFADASEICAALRRRNRPPTWQIAAGCGALAIVAALIVATRPSRGTSNAANVDVAGALRPTPSATLTTLTTVPSAMPPSLAQLASSASAPAMRPDIAPAPSIAASAYTAATEKAISDRSGHATGRRAVHPVGGPTSTLPIPSAVSSVSPAVRRENHDDDPLYRH